MKSILAPTTTTTSQCFVTFDYTDNFAEFYTFLFLTGNHIDFLTLLSFTAPVSDLHFVKSPVVL